MERKMIMKRNLIPKAIHRFYTTHQNPTVIYYRKKTHLTIHIEAQKTLDSQSAAEQKHNAVGISITCCKFYHRATGEQSTSTKQRRRSEISGISVNTCSHLTLRTQPLHQAVMMVKLYIHTWRMTLSLTLCSDQLHMDQRPNALNRSMETAEATLKKWEQERFSTGLQSRRKHDNS